MSLPVHPLTGQRVGYARISGASQNLDEQTDALNAAGCQKIFADTAAARSAPHTTSPTTAASRRPVPAPPAWPAGTPPAAAHPGPATTPPRRRRSPSGHPRSPAPACRRTPQVRPPCPAARSIRVSPGRAGGPVPESGPTKQAQAAPAGMALLALMVTGCPAKTPAGPGPGAAAKPAGEPAASAPPAGQTACRPGHGLAGLGHDIR